MRAYPAKLQGDPGLDQPAWDKAFFFIRLFAPVYFVLFSLFRSYVETELLSGPPMFSFYRGLHHVMWNATAALALILTLHVMARVEIKKLLFMLYGVTFMSLPLLHAILTGNPLSLTYLHGSLGDIVRDIATFCLLNPHNRPLGLEIMLLGSGIGLLCFWFTRNAARAVLAGLCAHIILNVTAIHWVGPAYAGKAVFPVFSAWSIHPFLAVFYLHTATAAVVLVMWRQGLFRDRLSHWSQAAMWGAAAWAAALLATWWQGWFEAPCDIIMSGLPVFTAAVISVRIYKDASLDSGSRWVLVVFSGLLFFQLLILTPIYLGIQESLTGPARIQWALRLPPG